MKNKSGRSILFAIILCFQFSVAYGQILHREDIKPVKDGIQGEQEYRTKIEIGRGVSLGTSVEVTSHENGTLQVANLKLRVFKESDDGFMYLGGLLHVEFVDITGDGFKDLVITGTVVHTGDKETDPRTYEAVTSIYVFDPQKKGFRLAFHCGPTLEY